MLESSDQYISPFHDIPLFVTGGDGTVCNMIVEIPRWTNAKMEVYYLYVCMHVATVTNKCSQQFFFFNFGVWVISGNNMLLPGISELKIGNNICRDFIPKSCKVGELSILYFNARNLLPKIDELKALRTAVQPHVIICIVETWLGESIQDVELSIENYNLVRLDGNRHGGGVLVYLITSLSFNIVFSGSNDLELLVLSVSFSSSVITLCTFYRPPSTPCIIFDTLLSDHIWNIVQLSGIHTSPRT